MITILFADDEPWFTESLRYKLEAKGYECLSVTDMTAALKTMELREISVVVTDIMMPPGGDFPKIDSQETGFHLIKRLRAEWPKTAIVCLSVIGDQSKINSLRTFKIEYLRKGEIPLSSAIQAIERAAHVGGEKSWRF